MGAVCLASLDHREPAENPASQANPEHQAPQEIQASPQRHHANRPLHPRASRVPRGHPDLQDLQEAQAIQAKLALQDVQELMLLQAAQDHADHQAHRESPVQLVQTESQACLRNQNHSCQENQESPAIKDQADLQDHLDHQDKTDHQDQQARRESQARTEPPGRTVKLDQQDLQEAAEHKARRVSARNTAPWTAVSSSKMELVVKQPALAEQDSQVSQQNAVFLLLFCVPYLLTPFGTASKLA